MLILLRCAWSKLFSQFMLDQNVVQSNFINFVYMNEYFYVLNNYPDQLFLILKFVTYRFTSIVYTALVNAALHLLIDNLFCASKIRLRLKLKVIKMRFALDLQCGQNALLLRKEFASEYLIFPIVSVS